VYPIHTHRIGNDSAIGVTMKKYRLWFIGIYVLTVIGSLQNYKKQYGMEVLSPIGIFDNFVFSLVPAFIVTGLVMIIHKTYLRITGKR
jgi:hypothetical protein